MSYLRCPYCGTRTGTVSQCPDCGHAVDRAPGVRPMKDFCGAEQSHTREADDGERGYPSRTAVAEPWPLTRPQSRRPGRSGTIAAAVKEAIRQLYRAGVPLPVIDTLSGMLQPTVFRITQDIERPVPTGEYASVALDLETAAFYRDKAEALGIKSLRQYFRYRMVLEQHPELLPAIAVLTTRKETER